MALVVVVFAQQMIKSPVAYIQDESRKLNCWLEILLVNGEMIPLPIHHFGWGGGYLDLSVYVALEKINILWCCFLCCSSSRWGSFLNGFHLKNCGEKKNFFLSSTGIWTRVPCVCRQALKQTLTDEWIWNVNLDFS